MDYLCQIVSPDTDVKQALIAGVRDEKIAIPLSAVLSIEKVEMTEISMVDSEDVIYLRGRVIPLIYLEEFFKLGEDAKNKNSINVVVCKQGDSHVGLVVDELFGQEDIQEKPLGILDFNKFFTGAAIMEDEDLAMVINVQSFIA